VPCRVTFFPTLQSRKDRRCSHHRHGFCSA